MCPDDLASPQPHTNRERRKFADLTEAIETANFVEKMLESEREWIANRLLWLFTSQSFLVLAFVGFVTRQRREVGTWIVLAVVRGVPAVGILTSILAGLGIKAAHHEATRLGNRRAKLTEIINKLSPVQLPKIGGDRRHRKNPWTHYLGDMTQILLPWILFFFWVWLLVAVQHDWLQLW